VELVAYPSSDLKKSYELAKSVDVAMIAQTVGAKSYANSGPAIKLAIWQARTQAIKQGGFA
jgi:hypothetical protein